MIVPLDDAHRISHGKRWPVVSGRRPSAHTPSRAAGLGVITSRPKGAATDLEYHAWRLGITVREAAEIMGVELCR